ncbi:MAG: hypothetical protein WCJ75_13805 [Desulfomonile sp.]
MNTETGDHNCLDDETTLREVAAWWREGNGRLVQERQGGERPDLAGPRRIASIRICEPLHKASVIKAKADNARTGGSFSGLVQFLLWQYLDFDDSLLKKPDET